MRVALLAGGRSSEHEVSLASATAVRAGLLEAGHEPVLVEIARDGRWRCDGEPVAVEPGGGLLGADVVFPVLHGPYGEDGTVQGLLEIADVPYVGAGVLASALCIDKLVFKRAMACRGLPQVEFAAVYRGGCANGMNDDARAGANRETTGGLGAGELERLGLPVFVKPARLGSSVGISKVSRAAELPHAIDVALRHDPRVIVEAASGGMEVECSVIGNDADAIASEPGQIEIEVDWYDFEAKYEPGGMKLVVPAPLADQQRVRVRSLALEAFRHTGCTGLARVDFFVEPDGRVLLNELNTMPGFTQTSVFARLFEASGISYPELVDRLVSLAVERYRDASQHSF